MIVMTPAQRLALARVTVTEVAVLLARRLRLAGEHRAASILIDVVPEVAEELARDTEEPT